jgi:uncharacterized protein YndB with AHSA1/START domain
MTVSDRIEKTIVLRAPIDRVWRAISTAREFGAWFGCAFESEFVAGARVSGTIQPTRADAEVAKLQEPHKGKPFEFWVERIDAPRAIAFRWHPFAIDPNVDYSNEPTTLIVFELTEIDGGTRLQITESGFDKIPLERRARAFVANETGWEHQTRLVEKYLNLHG